MKTLVLLSLALAGIAGAQTIHDSNPPTWWISAQVGSTAMTCRNSTCECEADGKTCRKPAPKKPAGQKKAKPSTIKMSNRAGGNQPVLACESPDGTWIKAHDCKITDGHNLDEIVRSWAAMVQN